MLAALVISLLAVGEPSAEQTALLKTFREEFIAVTPGEGKFPKSFKMGEGEKVREVTLGRKFQIAKYEVPQNLWEAVLGSNPSKWKGKRNSVEMLSLAEANAFCKKATELMRAAKLIESGEEIRLPTEEEWEYTARGGTTTKYSFGDDAIDINDYAWHTGNASGNDPPVGAKKPNGWGLYDVHGYLWEWTIAEGAGEGQSVLRGGSWKDTTDKLTSSYRRVEKADLQDDAVGLRCVLCAVAEEKPAEPIVPAGSKLELLWAEGEFTEGPALAPDGSIFFSDIGNAIYRYDPKSGKTEVFRKPSGRSNGLMFNPKGELIAAEGANTGGNRRISITSGIQGGKEGEVKTLSAGLEGKKFNSPNDLAIDSEGNVYFSDPRYVGKEPRELDFEAVFFVKPDGTTTVATRDLQKPNGILVSPDGKHIYVSDNNGEGNRQLLSFDIELPGKLTNKKVLHDFVTGRGIDGMTLDTAGNIYATAGTGDKAGIYVFSSSGKQLAMIPTPGDPTNCVFGGGDDSGTLYITSAAARGAEIGPKYGLFRIKLKAKGFHVVKLK
ncbi:MAG: SMP-30/gluconolactonase/LRE family protein [Pirellulaceae bacterium]